MPLGVILDDGTQHKTTISIAPSGSTITIANAIPTGRSVPVESPVVQGVLLDGNIDFQVVGVVLVSHDWFVFTNGVDVVKRYDGTDCVDVPGMPSAQDKRIVCRTLALYNNSLFLINTIEEGAAFPRRVRRSNNADPTDWVNGTAGFNDLLDGEDPLHAAELLGPYLIIYSERSIIRGEFLGTGGIDYDFTTMVRGEGSISSAGVADVGDKHIVMMQSNVYEYKGGFDLEPVGDDVYYRLYGKQASMSPERKHRAFSFYVEEMDEVWCFYSSTQASLGGCDRLLRYNVGEETWSEREFLDEFVGFGFFQSRGSRPWSSLIGSWLQQNWRWNERTLTSNSPTTHLCPVNLTQVMEYDYVQPLDNGQGISYTVESKDFLSTDVEKRFDLLEMGIRGDNVLVEVSIDSGLSWTTLGTVSRVNLGRARLEKQFIFLKVRFRWSGSGQFLLTWFGFYHKDESYVGKGGEGGIP
jgi:hypothetical protein